MALTGLTLLLLGCLLGFVLPASLEVRVQERANQTLISQRHNGTQDVNSTTSTDRASSKDSLNVTVTLAAQPANATTEVPATTPPEQADAGIVPTSLSPPGKEIRPKWWIPLIHGNVANPNLKNVVGQTSMPKLPTTASTATTIDVSSSSSVVSSAVSSSVSSPASSPGSASKAFLRHLREHSENELLKSNGTHGVTETARPNVRRVTSYPRLNTTSTTVPPRPSVVTRHVYEVP